MRGLHLIISAVAAASGRPNVCFTAHAKTALYCTHPLVDGDISVYDDSQSPQKARKLYSAGGKLCETKRCSKCLDVGGAWKGCGAAKKLPVHVTSQRDWTKSMAVLLALAVVAVPIGVFRTLGGVAKVPASKAASGSKATGIASGVVDFLLRFASAWWFPVVAALGTAINMFTIIFTGATVVLFLAGVLGQKKRWPYASLANAAGATLGAWVLLLLVRERGIEYLNESFPALLASPAWAKAMGYMQTYGLGGMLFVSSLPLILHPVIAFGLISGMSNSTILTIVRALPTPHVPSSTASLADLYSRSPTVFLRSCAGARSNISSWAT